MSNVYLYPMKKEANIKNLLIQQIHHLLKNKVKEIELTLAETREARDADSKSSAGDKHETSRALAQTELDKLEMQLNKTLQLQKEFTMLPTENKQDLIGQGSLVFTNHENYLIAIALGKLVVENEIYYVISAASPLGKNLLGNKMGDHIIFQGREIQILTIV
jgi:transcription elongation GreA/GreB family factor